MSDFISLYEAQQLEAIKAEQAELLLIQEGLMDTLKSIGAKLKAKAQQLKADWDKSNADKKQKKVEASLKEGQLGFTSAVHSMLQWAGHYPIPESVVKEWFDSLKATNAMDGYNYFAQQFNAWINSPEGEKWNEKQAVIWRKKNGVKSEEDEDLSNRHVKTESIGSVISAAGKAIGDFTKTPVGSKIAAAGMSAVGLWAFREFYNFFDKTKRVIKNSLGGGRKARAITRADLKKIVESKFEEWYFKLPKEKRAAALEQKAEICKKVYEDTLTELGKDIDGKDPVKESKLERRETQMGVLIGQYEEGFDKVLALSLQEASPTKDDERNWAAGDKMRADVIAGAKKVGSAVGGVIGAVKKKAGEVGEKWKKAGDDDAKARKSLKAKMDVGIDFAIKTFSDLVQQDRAAGYGYVPDLIKDLQRIKAQVNEGYGE